MAKKLKHVLSLFLIAAVLSSLTLSSFAADAPAGAPGGAPGSAPAGMPPGGMPGGGTGGAPGGGRGGGPVNQVPDKAAIYIKDGAENTASEYTAGLYKANVKSDANGITIQDVNLTSGDYAFNGIIATGAKTSVTLDKVKIILDVTKPVDSKDKGGNAASVGSGAAMYIKNSELQVGGAGRYVTAAYDEAKIVINDSSVTQTGSNENTAKIAEPISNEKLQISGTARANFSVGATKTYYFNSTCTAEGWAALSTDSSTGNGLDLYAYNTRATTRHGGYGTYADFHCRVWLYGSTLTSPEIGVIISKSGQVVVADGAQAPADVLKYNLGKTTTLGSTVTGGRNAVMIHAPDMFKQGKGAADCGTFNVINSTLATGKDLKSTVDYAKKYSPAVGEYINYINGAAILVKSTSVNINLENAKIDSFSRVIAMTVLNSDSMGNYLAEGDAGTGAVKPIAISMKNMSVNGEIKHMDYQRIMTLSLDNATLKGAIVSGTVEEWNKLWSSYKKADCSWVQNDTWNTYYGVQMTVKKGATWEVTGPSTLSSLTVENGGTIKGKVQVDGKDVIPTAGKTLTGKITVKP